jgi:sigma-B regulation protein RsbU (phosphoserine phosphatase)
MKSKFQIGGARWNAWMARQSRIGRLCVRVGVPFILAIVLLNLHIVRTLDIVIISFASLILAPLLPILAYRWFTRRVLWKVRNRLYLTYLLMGLAPVVLFATLGGIAAYLFAGQFATDTALSILDQASLKVKDETASEAAFNLSEKPRTQPRSTGTSTLLHHATTFANSRVSLEILDGPTWRPLLASTVPHSDPMPIAGQPAPPWLHTPYRGVVALKGRLYICSVISVPTGNTSVVVLGSRPLDAMELDEMSKGLGTVSLYSGYTHLTDDPSDSNTSDTTDNSAVTSTNPNAPKEKVKVVVPPKSQADAPRTDSTDNTSNANDESVRTVKGAPLTPRTHFFDTPVTFFAALPIKFWASGKNAEDPMVVASRPSLLYAHLFANSVDIGTFVRVVLVSIGVFFALIELFALLMAFGLSRTITRSVSDIYRGTREIDAGNFDHRIRVARHDQLGALASSFNGMAASVRHLLQQQREKERLLNELKIAQEVQTTLFPSSPALLGGLEMHALCIPASTVGGDYYDFIFGSHSGLCLALGDISGKGISAALLMASLHSAVRAFSLGEDTDNRTQPSPALLLKLLNRHLYLSTQSARYATLFLAFYDVKTHQLTYSNGGHLPPLLLSTDGKVRRLDCGGSVVGLLDDLDYVEETVQMEPGDLLIAFTDGLTEPENTSGGEFGEARLLDLMRQHRTEPLPTLAANTLTVIKQWIGNQDQPDDMTILLARQL